MDVKYFRLDELQPYEKNPRKNNNAVDVVANSIKKFGFKVPIVIDADNVIVCGHTRYKAARKLGLDSVPCIIADDLTPEQIRAFRLADNKTAEFAAWDFGLLETELADISFDMNGFGFTLSDFDTIDNFFEEVKSEKTPMGTAPKNKSTETIVERKSSDVEISKPIVEKVECSKTDENNVELPNNEINSNTIICPHCGRKFVI